MYTLSRRRIGTVVVRNYWWAGTAICLYFTVGFWLWHGSRAAMLSSALALLAAVAGLVAHYLIHWTKRWPQVVMIMAHLVLGQMILAWQKVHLPLSDYTTTGSPATRDFLIYLTSTLIMGTMSMLGGWWGALASLPLHYAFIFDVREEFSLKWIFPLFMVCTGAIVSTSLWRLDDAYEQLENLANRDHLTGLLNRHRLVPEFERLQAMARETGHSLLLVAWDLDGLKKINDQKGHAAGDAHIRNFALALQANVRKPSDSRYGDAAFRVGGDEFISMHLDAHDGEKVMERVHQSHPFVSAGWVLCNKLNLDQALTQADKALYDRKERRKKDLNSGVRS